MVRHKEVLGEDKGAEPWEKYKRAEPWKRKNEMSPGKLWKREKGMGPERGQMNRALEQMKQAKPCNWANTLRSGRSERNRALDERQRRSHGKGESNERSRVLGQKKEDEKQKKEADPWKRRKKPIAVQEKEPGRAETS